MRLPVRSTKRNSPKHIRFPTRHQKKLEEEGIGNLLTFCGRMDPNLRQKITSTKHLVSFSFPQDWSNVGTPEKIFPVCLFVFCECVCVRVVSFSEPPDIHWGQGSQSFHLRRLLFMHQRRQLGARHYSSVPQAFLSSGRWNKILIEQWLTNQK